MPFAFVVAYGSKRRLAISAGTPSPSSATMIATCVGGAFEGPSARDVTVISSAALSDRVDRVLDEVRQHLDHLVAVGPDPRERARLGVNDPDAFAGPRALELDDVADDLLDVNLLRARRGEAREAGELGDDVADPVDLVEDRAGRLVEVVVEGRIVARAEAAQGLDRGADRGERVFHLVRDAAGDLAPGRDPARGGEAAAGRAEVVEHPVEGLRQLGDLAGATHAEGARLIGGDLARLVRELLDRAPDPAREEDGEEERRAGGGEGGEQDRPVDAGEVLVERRLRLGDADAHLRPGGIVGCRSSPAPPRRAWAGTPSETPTPAVVPERSRRGARWRAPTSATA